MAKPEQLKIDHTCHEIHLTTFGRQTAANQQAAQNGPVQLKETSASVSAIKKIPRDHPLLALFALFSQEFGRVSS